MTSTRRLTGSWTFISCLSKTSSPTFQHPGDRKRNERDQTNPVTVKVAKRSLHDTNKHPANDSGEYLVRGETRALVYYWYQSRGRVIAEDWKKIVYQFWDRATQRRTDGSLVRFTIPVVRGNLERADAAFLDLARWMAPLLPDYLPD